MTAMTMSYLLSVESYSQTTLHILWSGRSFYLISFVYVSFRYILGLYEQRLRSRVDIIFKIILVFIFTSLAIILANYLFDKERTGIFGRQVLFGGLVAASIIQIIISMAVQNLLKKKLSKRNFLFIANRETQKWLFFDLKRNKFLAKSEWLLYEDWISETENKKSESEYMKEFITNLNLKITQHNFDTIIISICLSRLTDRIVDSLIHLRFQGHDIFELSTFYENEFRQLPVSYLSSQILLLKEGFSIIGDPVGLRVKRLVDIVLSFLLLVLTWPLMIITMILIRFESKGPILYSQLRTGLAGRNFKIYKFRSMITGAEKDGTPQWAQPKDARITRVGKFIRLVRLDELPQIFNILKGDMSFIGPRPERPEFNHILSEQIPFYELRHSLRPGLTGWAQVIYQYGGSVDDARQKLQYDLFYIKNQSFLMDLKIIMMTIKVVMFGKGR